MTDDERQKIYDAMLRKVTEAIHTIDCTERPCTLELTVYGRYGRYAAAALAAFGMTPEVTS
jgi:hypothetical protein